MTCPVCGAESAGQVIRQDAAGERIWQCVNGHTWARVGCEKHRRGAGPCGQIPSLRCVNCSEYVCREHEESRRGRMCQSCARRVANVVRGPARHGAWARTGGMHDE